MGLVAAKCTNCNANIEVDDSKEAGVCKYCNTAFITEKVINQYITNVTNNDYSQKVYNVENLNIFNSDYGRIDAVETYESSYNLDNEKVIRNVFSYAREDKNLPLDFFEKLDKIEVEVFYKEYLEVTRDIEYSWNATIGLNRTENYVEYVKNAEGVTIPENRTRSVTDWHPQNGVTTFAAVRSVGRNGVFNYESDSSNLAYYKSYFKNASKSVEEKSKKSAGFDLIEKQVRDLLQNDGETAKKLWTKEPFGDTFKNLSGSVKNKNIIVNKYIVPFCRLTYYYAGCQYKVEFFAQDAKPVSLPLPGVGILNVNSYCKNAVAKEKSKFSMFLTFTIIAAVLNIFIFSLSTNYVSPLVFIFYGIAGVFGVCAIILLVFTIKNYKIYKTKLKKVQLEVIDKVKKSYDDKMNELFN